MDSPWLLFLHGINAADDDHWLTPLEDAISRSGGEPFEVDHILTPDYRAVLRGGSPSVTPPSPTYKAPAKDAARRAKTGYLSRMALLETSLRPLSNATSLRYEWPQFAEVPPLSIVEEARRYARSADTRAAVHHAVLQSLQVVPEGARVVILAHSLGSVVAADLVKLLPPHLRVQALVTIGSPLGAISGLRTRELVDFPFDRLGAWVNIFDPRDPVTGGRGVSEHYPWAIDIPVLLQDWFVPELTHQHHAEYYGAHPAVGAAIVAVLRSSALGVRGAEAPSRVDGLELLLLQSLYLRELAKRLPTNDFERLARLERARRFTAAGHAAAAALIHQQNPTTTALQVPEFLQRPDAHIRGAWDDSTVLALAIMLASGVPAPPFRIEHKPDVEERRKALISTLSLIRTHESEPTDVDIVDAVFSVRAKVMSYLAQGRSWVPAALIAAGVVTLAATGIGLAVAVPAGLAGAALVTSTLAVFGPGGMIGGMATLAALAGAGSAMAAAGAAWGLGGETRATPDLMSSALDEAVASGDVEVLRSLLVSLLTLVGVQEMLGFRTQRDQVLMACLNARAPLTLLIGAHESIDPRSEATKEAKDMLPLLDKACRWLRGEENAETPDAREWAKIATSFAHAVEGRPDLFVDVLSGQGRHNPAPRALETLAEDDLDR